MRASREKESSQPTGKVLVLGDGSRAFLAVIRSLGRRKLRVNVGWCSPSSLALHSKYVAKRHDIPRYAPDSQEWKQALLAILEREGFDLVIPCSDRTLLPLQANRSEVERFAPVALPRDDAFDIVFDKYRSNQLAKSLSIPTPREMTVHRPDEAEAVLAAFRLPVVLKPPSSFTLDDLQNRQNVRKVYRPEQLAGQLETLIHGWGKVLAQENFIGAGVGVEVLADQGDLLLAFQHVRVHEPLRGGGSSYRKSQPVRPDLLDATARLMKALRYTGVAMVEYKVNPVTGEWIFIEINGRFWGSLPLAVAAGADFPYYLYRLLVHGQRDFPQKYRTGIYGRNLSRDFDWMLQNLKADRSDPTLATVPLHRVAGEILNVLTLRERSDALVMDDPKPGLVELAALVSRFPSRVLKRLPLSRLALPLRRRISRQGAIANLSEARTVLFVCKGNICRSPFAHYYAEANFPASVKIMSAGYYPVAGRRCPEAAVEAARTMGVDLSRHRSSCVTEKMVREAEVIFTFDEENCETLVNKYPFAKQKIRLLGMLAPQGPVVIKDPHGGNIDLFKTTYQTITRNLEEYTRQYQDRSTLAHNSNNGYKRGNKAS